MKKKNIGYSLLIGICALFFIIMFGINSSNEVNNKTLASTNDSFNNIIAAIRCTEDDLVFEIDGGTFNNGKSTREGTSDDGKNKNKIRTDQQNNITVSNAKKCESITVPDAYKEFVEVKCDNSDGADGHIKILKLAPLLSVLGYNNDCTLRITAKGSNDDTGGGNGDDTQTPSNSTSTTGGSTTTLPTTEVDTCAAGATSMKIEQTGTYGRYGNHTYEGEDNKTYFCVNPGGGLPVRGCLNEVSISDLMAEGVNGRGQAAIIQSGVNVKANDEDIADALNVYSCTTQIGLPCEDSGDRDDKLKSDGNALYEAVQAFLSNEITVTDDNTDLTSTEGTRKVTIDLQSNTEAGFGRLYTSQQTKYVAKDKDTITTSQLWTQNKIKVVDSINNIKCSCNGNTCNDISLSFDSSTGSLKMTGLSKLQDDITDIACNINVSTSSVSSTVEIPSGLIADETIARLVIEGFLARNDSSYNILANPYKIDVLTTEPTGTGNVDLKVKFQVTSNSTMYPVSNIDASKLEGNTLDGSTVTISQVSSESNNGALVFEAVIQNGNFSTNGLCTPVAVSIIIPYTGASGIEVNYVISNSQELFASFGTTFETANTESTVDINVQRPDCQEGDCFNGSNSLKAQYQSGKLTLQQYADKCCAASGAESQFGADYATYCEGGCKNQIQAPTCERDGTSGSIQEGGDKGINKTIYNACFKGNGRDINGDSYKMTENSNMYCDVYCKEDAEYIFQGFGYNPQTEFTIVSGQYFTFNEVYNEGDLPWFHQKRSCLVEVYYAKFLRDLYGRTFALNSIESALSGTEASMTGGYYGAAKQAAKDYATQVEEYFKQKKIVEDLQKQYPNADSLCESAHRAADQQNSQRNTCITNCPGGKNYNACVESCPSSAPDPETTDSQCIAKNEIIEHTELMNAAEAAYIAAENSYTSNKKSLEDSITKYNACLNFQNIYGPEDLPTVENFFYSEMTTAGQDVAGVIDQVTITAKEKELTIGSGDRAGVAGITSVMDKNWATIAAKLGKLFTIDGVLPTPSEDLKANVFINQTLPTEYYKHDENEETKFFDFGLSAVEATVSYGIGVELFSQVPSGNLITQTDPLFGIIDVQHMGFGMPVSISTRAAQYIYRFQIANFGKGGRLSRAINRTMSAPEYICSYFVGNKITCPTGADSGCINCGPEDGSWAYVAPYTINTSSKLNNQLVSDNKSSDILSVSLLGSKSAWCSNPTIDRIPIEQGELIPSPRTVSLSSLNPNNRDSFANSNWGTKAGIAVQKEIEENGDAIYQEKDPMYSFTLDTTTIRNIREYNSTTEYDDFALDCDNENGRHCISSFINDYATNDLSESRTDWKEYHNGKINKTVDDNEDYGKDTNENG